MVSALGKMGELASHVRGAIRNGCSEAEIREALIQVCVYCGVPAGMEACKTADKVITDMKAEGIEVK